MLGRNSPSHGVLVGCRTTSRWCPLDGSTAQSRQAVPREPSDVRCSAFEQPHRRRRAVVPSRIRLHQRYGPREVFTLIRTRSLLLALLSWEAQFQHIVVSRG